MKIRKIRKQKQRISYSLLNLERIFRKKYSKLVARIEAVVLENMANVRHRNVLPQQTTQNPHQTFNQHLETMTHNTEKCIAFLGGTCADTNWRDELINLLSDETLVFNPVVDDWTRESQCIEDLMKEKLPVHVYVFTPQMQGMYAVAEATCSIMQRDKVTVFCALDSDSSDPDKTWTNEQVKSWRATELLWLSKGGCMARTLNDVAQIIEAVHQSK